MENVTVVQHQMRYSSSILWHEQATFIYIWDLFCTLKQVNRYTYGSPHPHYQDFGSTSINMVYLAGKITNTNYIVFSLTNRLHLLNKYLSYGYKLSTHLISLNKCCGHHHELVDHYRMCMSHLLRHIPLWLVWKMSPFAQIIL